MTSDPDLFSQPQADHQPDPITLLFQRVNDYLKTHPDWTCAKTLWALYAVDERTLRQIAADSDGFIISGQRGYKHISHATTDEIDHAANWLEAQAKKMATRAQSIRRRAHQIFA